MVNFVDTFADRMLQIEIPVWRIYLGVRRLHPTFRGRAFIWNLDSRSTTVRLRPHGIEDTPYYRDNPIAEIFSTGTMMRRRLRRRLADDDYPLFHSLKEQGATDYFALPLNFHNNAYQAIAFTSGPRGGFKNDDIDVFKGIVPSLSAVVELFNERDDAKKILATYVGERAGEKILGGAIQRGGCETVNSILWLCDMAKFTEIAEVLSPADLIELLDDYFDAVVKPIENAGGEVLKFMGDAVLAIFDLTKDQDPKSACLQACLAATAALNAVTALNARWRSKAGRPIDFGIALHVGPVSYGNVGSHNRLDFTAIGPAVNLVCRLERLTRTVNRPIVLSEEFARLLNRPLLALGSFKLKGISRKQSVYGLAEPMMEKLTMHAVPEIYDG